MTQEASMALSKAKIHLMSLRNMTFITTIVLSVKYVLDEAIPTAETDGKTIWIKPSWFLALNEKERVGLVLHECWHIALKHVLRGIGRNEKKFNYAADYYINLMLKDAGITIPEGGLIDERYRGLSSEQIYDLLPDSLSRDDLLDLRNGDGSSLTKEQRDALSEHVDNLLVKAATQAKMAGDKPGSIPGEVELYLDKLLNPKLPWNTILRKFISSCSKNDYSWRRPNKRYMPDMYLPSLYSEALTEFAIGLDLSGSVSDQDVQYFGNEVYKAFKDMQPKEITLLTFDTKIRDKIKLHSATDMKRHALHGRGGTCVKDLMQWAKTAKPVVLVVLTDGEFNWTGVENPKIPVVWLIHNNTGFTANFGKVIHYELQHDSR